MSVTDADAYELTKAQLGQTQRLMKSKPARKFLKKRQLERGGVGEGFYKTKGRAPDGSSPGRVVKADGYIRTIYDMVDYHYGFVPEYVSKEQESLSKADDPILTTDTGVRNAVYGSEVFSLVNSEPNIFALLENRAWTKSGERIVTAHGHGVASGGSAENATLPDTDHPTLDQFETSPKTIAHNFDVSQVKQLLADTDDDDLEDPFDWLRRWYGTGTEHQTGMGEHPKHLNEQLGSDADSTAGTNLETIDRAISNSAETTIHDSASDADIYGFDRSGNEFESNVVENAGSNRTFTLDLMDDAIREVKVNSGKRPVSDDNYFWLTHPDTYQRIEDEVGGKERLQPERVEVGLNGVNTNPGDDVGLTVQSYKNIPIFESVDVPVDGLGRIYLVDSSTMFIKTLLPTQFYSTGTEVDGNPFGIDRLGNEGMFVTIGELTCVNPKAHAKVRDLK